MRKCPLCQRELEFIQYEGFRIQGCPGCKGHFLEKRRLQSIERTKRLKPEELKEEASTDFRADTKKKISCPRCGISMDKRPIPSPVPICLDECRNCEAIWLDGGELALLQLAHEASRKSLNNEELKRRMAELNASPSRKREFEENLRNLPEGKSLIDCIGEALDESLGRSLARELFLIGRLGP